MSAISQVTIYRPSGTSVTVTISDSSQRVRKLMAENYVEVNFRSATYIDIPVGSFFDHELSRYVKTRKQVPIYENGGWTYTEQFDDADGQLRRFRIKYHGQDFQEMAFALTATLSDFAALIVSDINRYLTNASYFQWATGNIDATLEDRLKTISFSGDTLFDACTAIAQEFETEWYITKEYIATGSAQYEKVYLNFRKNWNNSEVPFEIGSGKILNQMNPQRGEDSEFGTRFYVFGGTRNLTDDYKEVPAGSSVPNLYENRLHLPDNQAYIDARNGVIVQDLALNEIVEQYVTFDDIYPKNRDTITGVTSQTVVDEDDNEYTQYTIQADDCPFAGKGDIIDTLGIKFETGELAGQEFEAKMETEQLPWNKRLIIVAKDLGTDGQHLWVPNPSIKPSVGDVFVLTGVKLPTSKIEDAEDELLATAEDYAKQHSSDTDVYECVSNNVYCYDNLSDALSYDIGTKVRLQNTDLFGSSGRSSRVQGVTFSLTKPWEITWEVGDNTKYSRFGNVQNTLAEVTYSQRIGIYDTSVLNLIKSTDYQSPSDTNVYTALATYNHIYKRHDHKDRLIRPAVFVVPTLSPSAAGFSLDDNEVAFWCDTLGNYAETPEGGGGGGGETLTVTKNGQSWLSYNGSQAVTLNLVVPTKVSDLDNDSGFLTASTLPIASANTLGGIKVGNTLTISNEVLNVVVGSVAQSNTGFVTGGDVYSAIAAAVTSALHYRGMSSTALTDGGTETAIIGGVALTPQSGDVVIYNGFEFLWENNVWNKLGDDTSFVLKTIQITGDGTYITGGGDLTTSRSLGLSQAAIDALTLASTAVQPTALDAYLRKIDVSGNISIDSNNGEGGVTSTATNLEQGFKTTDTIWDCTRKWYFECVCKPVMGSNLKFLTHKGIGTGGSLRESLFRINNNNIQVGVNSNGSTVYPISTSFVNLGLVANTWYHFMVVYDGTYVYLYANGVLKYTSSAYTFVDVLIGTSGWYMNPAHSPKLGRAGYLADSDVVADVVAAHYNGNNPFGYDSSVEGANCILEYLPENMLTTSITNTAPGGYSYTYPTPKTFDILTENPWAAELTGTGIPTTAPLYKGQKYIDTTTGLVYNALGNETSYDWSFLVINTDLNNFSFDNLASHPTTLSGYGITDAKIANGVITLGSNSITPITSSDHKALTLKVGSTTIGSDYNALVAKTYTITAQNITNAIGSTTYAPYNANGYVPTTRKVNNKALSSDITLSLDDVADGSTRKLADYLPLAGGTLTGNLLTTNIYPSSNLGGALGSTSLRFGNAWLGQELHLDDSATVCGIYRGTTQAMRMLATTLRLGEGYAVSGGYTDIYGEQIRLYYSTSKTLGLTLDSSGTLIASGAMRIAGNIRPNSGSDTNSIGQANYPFTNIYGKTITASTSLVSSGTLSVTGAATLSSTLGVGGSITPSVSTADLGNSNYPFRDLYLSQDLLMSAQGAKIKANSQDFGLYYYSSGEDDYCPFIMWDDHDNIYIGNNYDVPDIHLQGDTYADLFNVNTINSDNVNVSAKLAIPTSAPSSPSSGKIYLWCDTTGNYAELPNS